MSRFALRRTRNAELTVAQAADRLVSVSGAKVIAQDPRNLLIDVPDTKDDQVRDIATGFIVSPDFQIKIPDARQRPISASKNGN